MTRKSLRKQHGIVVLLDALGASSYPDEKIKKFLSVRTKLNDILSRQAKVLGRLSKIKMPNIYTFGDTLILTMELRSKIKIKAHIYGIVYLMQNYLYYSLIEGILFRGAFSVGSYIEDYESNTVMGEAISDAASWYEKTDWMGISCTPKTNNILEFHFKDDELNKPLFIHYYPVPMKDGREINLYTISWAGRFFQDVERIPNPKKRFLELLKDQLIPPGTESKFENTKKYFNFIEDKIISNKSMQLTAEAEAD